MKICRICGIEKELIKFKKTKVGDKVYYNTFCRECKKNNKHITIKRVSISLEEKKERIKRNQHKYYHSKKKFNLKYRWSNKLYEYIVSRNLFNEDELIIVKYFLRKVDELGRTYEA